MIETFCVYSVLVKKPKNLETGRKQNHVGEILQLLTGSAARTRVPIHNNKTTIPSKRSGTMSSWSSITRFQLEALQWAPTCSSTILASSWHVVTSVQIVIFSTFLISLTSHDQMPRLGAKSEHRYVHYNRRPASGAFSACVERTCDFFFSLTISPLYNIFWYPSQ